MTDADASLTNATILVVDDSPLNLNMVEQVLRRTGYTVHTAENGYAALEKMQEVQPELVVLDVMMPGMDGFEVCQRIRADENISGAMVLMLTAHDTLVEKMRGFESGADDYMTKPYEVPELRRRVAALLERAAATRQTSEANPTSRATHVAIFNLRGGVGVTAIATSLATALAGLWSRPTLLVDLVFTAGQAALMLNLPLKVTWSYLTQSKAASLTTERLKGALLSHSSGVNLLASPAQMTDSAVISVDTVTTVYELADSQFDYIVTDCPHDLSPLTRTALQRADIVLLPLTPDLASLRATATALDYFKTHNIPRERLRIVLNNTVPTGGLTREEIETTLATPIDLVLPYTGGAFLQAINSGIPITVSQTDLPAAGLLEDLAYHLSKPEHQQKPPAVDSAALGRVLQRLRRQRRERGSG